MTKIKIFVGCLLVAVCAAGWFYGIALGRQSESPRRVVFVTIDTLRADHLQSYGYPRPSSPFLKLLADQGTVFKNVFSASSHTAPAHASMFTGVFPFQHGLLANGARLNPEIFTVAKAFKAQGYKTAAFSSVRFMEKLFAFDLVGDEALPMGLMPPGKKKRAPRQRWYRPADQQVDRVLKWLKGEKPADKFFIWLHIYDVHQWAVRSLLPPEYPQKFADFSQPEFFEFLSKRHGLAPNVLSDKEGVLRMMNNYDGRLLFVDDQLRRLYQFMQARGLNEDAVWIVTSDHGEGLRNHNYEGHGEKIYQEQLHVPLIIHRPGDKAGGTSSEFARTVDYFPTLLELAGYDLPESYQGLIQGISLLGSAGDEGSASRLETYAFAQRRPKNLKGFRSAWEAGDVYSLQDSRYKYIFHSESQDEFFDLKKDPFELHNSIGVEPLAVQSNMLASLQRMVEGLPRVDGKYKTPKLNPETLEELQALGYL